MGSLYHSGQRPDSWKTQKNDIKAIRTRSGRTIELNDTDVEEFITIKENKNLITIDTANNNMIITALEIMTLNAKNIEINASEEIKMNAGTNLIARISEQFSISAKEATEMIEEMKTVVAKEILQNAEKIRIESSKQNLELVSSKQVDIKA